MLATISGHPGTEKTDIQAFLMNDRILGVRPLWVSITRKSHPLDPKDAFEYLTSRIFRAMEGRGVFLWSAPLCGSLYGIRREVALTSLAPGVNRLGVLVHDAVKAMHDLATECGAHQLIRSIHFLTPDEELLRKRLAQRGHDAASIERIIRECVGMDAIAKSSSVPYRFIQDNDDLMEKVVLTRDLFTRC